MKEKRKFEIDMSDDTVITEENIVHIGEVLAICAMKFRMIRHRKYLHQIYQGLIHDIFRSEDSTETFSDGYDIAQTAMLFLYEHVGKKLGDEILDRFGKKVTVRRECSRRSDLFILKEYVKPRKMTVSLNEDVKINGRDKTLDEENNNDYTAFDELVEKMHLTKREQETLSHLMVGLSCIEIAKIYNINRTTVWRNKKSLQKKYLQATQTL